MLILMLPQVHLSPFLFGFFHFFLLGLFPKLGTILVLNVKIFRMPKEFLLVNMHIYVCISLMLSFA